MDVNAEFAECRTFFEMAGSGERLLDAAGCPEPAADARILLFHVMGWNLTDYASGGRSVCDREKKEAYARLIERRMGREPVQYIVGTAPFFGYDFRVTPDVLIPRFDTEVLVDEVLSVLKDGDRILDMCTGSGCIAVTLALEMARRGRTVSVTASDISQAALHVAAENAERYGVQITTVHSDLFERIEGTYDIITVNPPYIEADVIRTLDPEVRVYEPLLALSGKEDGLYFYRKIVAGAKRYLSPGGLLALEIGADQAGAVEELMRGASFDRIRTIRDLSGNDRCVFGNA